MPVRALMPQTLSLLSLDRMTFDRHSSLSLPLRVTRMHHRMPPESSSSGREPACAAQARRPARLLGAPWQLRVTPSRAWSDLHSRPSTTSKVVSKS